MNTKSYRSIREKYLQNFSKVILKQTYLNFYGFLFNCTQSTILRQSRLSIYEKAFFIVTYFIHTANKIIVCTYLQHLCIRYRSYTTHFFQLHSISR